MILSSSCSLEKMKEMQREFKNSSELPRKLYEFGTYKKTIETVETKIADESRNFKFCDIFMFNKFLVIAKQVPDLERKDDDGSVETTIMISNNREKILCPRPLFTKKVSNMDLA